MTATTTAHLQRLVPAGGHDLLPVRAEPAAAGLDDVPGHGADAGLQAVG